MSGWSLIEEMLRGEAESRIDDTDVTQPALFALQVALTELWRSWGVRPARVIGHSVGEVAAAWAAGVYSLEDAVRIIYHRSRLQHTTAGQGTMIAVGLPLGDMLYRLNGHNVTIAAINSPTMLTLAGEPDGISSLADGLEAQDVFIRRLPIQYAFHSNQMDSIRDDLLEALADISSRDAEVPFYSTVTGAQKAGSELTPDYWWQNVRQPVSFSAALAELIAEGETTFLELGPHPALASAIQECLAEQRISGHVFHSLRRRTDESLELIGNVGRMFCAGLPLDWESINQSEGGPLRLPPYPMQAQTYELMSESFRQFSIEPLVHPLLGLRIDAPLPTWEVEIDSRVLTYLNDHRIWDSMVFPAAGYAEAGLALAHVLFPDDHMVIEDMGIKRAMFIAEGRASLMRTVYNPDDHSFTLYSRAKDDGEWQAHVTGYIRKLTQAEHGSIDVVELKESFNRQIDRDEFYGNLLRQGYGFGPDFRQVQNVWMDEFGGLGEVIASDRIMEDSTSYRFHPVLLDACVQIFSAAGFDDEVSGQLPYLPAGFGRIHLLADSVPPHFWVKVDEVLQTDQVLVINLYVYDTEGRQIAEIQQARFDRVAQSSLLNDELSNVYQFQWERRRLRTVPLPLPDGFPALDDVMLGVRDALPAVIEQYHMPSFYRDIPLRATAVMMQAVQNTLLDLGWDAGPGDVVRFDELADRLGIIPRHHSLFYRHLKALEQAGLLMPSDEMAWQVMAPFEYGDVEALLADGIAAHESFRTDAELLSATIENLAGIYRGLTDPLGVLFPDSSTSLLEAFYESSGEQAPHYDLIASAIRGLTESLPADRPLRILEVGAGTGGLTSALLDRLPMERVEYVFTDVTQRFLQTATQRFSDVGTIYTQLFDLSREPEDQGFYPGAFDVVLAANVLHAVPGVAQVLDRLRRIMVPGGLLMFLELTRSHIAYTSIFGVLDEWWGTTDDGLKPLAIHSEEEWIELLTGAGFGQIDAVRSSLDEAQGYCSTLFAQAPEADDGLPDKESTGGTAIVFADHTGLADDLVAALRDSGLDVVSVVPGEGFARIDEGQFSIDPGDEGQLTRLMEQVSQLAGKADHIVVAWGLDHTIDEMDGADLVRSQETGVLFGFRLARVLSGQDSSQSPQVVFLSRDAQPVQPGDALTGLDAAMLTGFVRVVNNEYPTYFWRQIDLDVSPSDEEAVWLASELLLPDGELEVAYRGGERWVNRLQRPALDSLPRKTYSLSADSGDERPYRLEMTQPGRIANLRLNLADRHEPGPGEVEVQVKAAGLNFRDLMKVLGLYPGKSDDLHWLGDDIAGVVTAVGDGVTGIKPGDEVFGFAPYGFQSRVSLDARLLIRKPAHLSFEQAATIPTVFMTAHYALADLAQMHPGEWVLIHAGTGGVGQAAIQVAWELRLEIIATAGTDEKRAFLREQGIEHVFNSRTLDYADEVMAVTGGRGVDAVLNSLAGDFIPKNLGVLAPFGRYLEIGKIDVYNNSKLGLETLKDNISLHIIDIGQMLTSDINRALPLTKAVESAFEQGIYQPLDYILFPIAEAEEAFRYMAQAKHMGKIVLSFDQPEIVVGAASGGEQRFRSDGAYLVVGGTRGLGLEIVKWMAAQGARHFTLMSRSGVTDDASAAAIEDLRADGVSVTVVQGDVTLPGDVEAAVSDIQAGPVPLIGVIHSAMILRDALLAERMDEDTWAEALWVKAAGIWNLHRATEDITLEHFISISSSTSIYGGSTQSNYSAGNAMLDAMAHYRHARGLPALTINFGAFSGVGHLSRDTANADFLDALGLKLMPLQGVLTALGELLQTDSPQAGVFRIDWNALGRALPMVLDSNVYSAIARHSMAAGTDDGMLEQILAAPPHQRPALLQQFLIRAIADVMDTDIDRIDLDVPLASLGLDSLMSVELVNMMNSQLSAVNMTLAVSEVLGANSLQDVANVLLRKFQGDEGLAEVASDSMAGMAALFLAENEADHDQPDLRAEAVLDADITIDADCPAPVDVPSHVLLTGASGFLGAYLLRDLLTHSGVQVTCLVRAEDEETASRRIRANMEAYGLWSDDYLPRIHAVPGDVSQPLLGLTPDGYEDLAQSVDTIIHNASDVNLVQPYHALKAVNVGGVKAILRLAVRARIKPVHYVSTASVFYATRDHNPLVTETDWADPASLPNGYRKSKWVAEQLLRQAMDRGVPCAIYRPSIISGDSQTGVTNMQDMPSRVLIGVSQLRAVSDRGSVWNMVPVDFVSRAIVYFVTQPEARGQVFHLTHFRDTSDGDIVRFLGAEHFHTLSYRDWRMALIQQAQQRIDNALIPLLPLFPEKPMPEVALNVSSEKTLDLLARGGITCPPIDDALLTLYSSYLIRSGALQPAETVGAST